MAAPSASVASMVLFDMIFSLLTSASVSKHWVFGFIPATGSSALEFRAAYGWNSGHTSRQFEADNDGSVNAATNFPHLRYCRRHRLCDLLVADDPGGDRVE